MPVRAPWAQSCLSYVLKKLLMTSCFHPRPKVRAQNMLQRTQRRLRVQKLATCQRTQCIRFSVSCTWILALPMWQRPFCVLPEELPLSLLPSSPIGQPGHSHQWAAEALSSVGSRGTHISGQPRHSHQWAAEALSSVRAPLCSHPSLPVRVLAILIIASAFVIRTHQG